MVTVTRNDAELLAAGIRVLAHLHGKPPTPEELADLLQLSAAAVRLQVAGLVELGALLLVESAFEDHLELGDTRLLQDLPAGDGPAISEDLKAFDARKEEEVRKMSRLFSSGEMEERKRKRLEDMEKGLGDLRRKKPRNPFSDA